jgi:hypothetical protein
MMILLAHIMGVPVEESLIAWLTGGAGATVATLLAIVRTKALSR